MFFKRKEFPKTISLARKTQKPLEYTVDSNINGFLKLGNAQSIGNRENQQDSFGYSDITSETDVSEKGLMAIISDGMGGLANGKDASEYVVREFLASFNVIDRNQNIPEQLVDTIEKINLDFYESAVFANNSKSGATIAATYMLGSDLYFLNVGDSRIYLKRQEKLYQISEDHNYCNLLFEDYLNGIGTIQGAKSDKQSAALSSYIGSPVLQYVDYNKKPLEILDGDEVILCSDGVYNSLSEKELIDCLKEDPQRAASRIIKLIDGKKIPGQDNSTVLIMQINYKEKSRNEKRKIK